MRPLTAFELQQLARDHSPDGLVKILVFIQNRDQLSTDKLYILQEMIRHTNQNALENLSTSLLGMELVRRAEAKSSK